MATTYPATKQTFTNPNGTQNLDSPDHAGLHSDKNDTVEALQDTVGTTAGTNVLMNFAAGDFPVRVNTSNVLQQNIQGTVNSSTVGTPAITGGTVNSATVGTPAITGGTLNNIVVGTPAITGGTIDSAVLGTPAITGGTMTNSVLTTTVVSGYRGTTIRNDSNITTNSATLVEMTNGSVSVICDDPCVLDINFSAIHSVAGGVAALYSLIINGTADSTWDDASGWDNSSSSHLVGFKALRTGFAAGTHTVRMKWRVSSTGTATIHSSELFVVPVGTA